jgi:hypothetical protein
LHRSFAAKAAAQDDIVEKLIIESNRSGCGRGPSTAVLLRHAGSKSSLRMTMDKDRFGAAKAAPFQTCIAGD